jgi:RsmE family RNA methyltransferase
VHQAQPGDIIKVGLLGGLMGEGRILSLHAERAELQVTFTQKPPAKLPLTLLLAMPRPKMFRRILQHCATLGVADIILFNSYRVEKSFWQTPFLQPKHIEENLLLGLEQARDTIMPTVRIEKRFKPFVEDQLPEIAAGSLGLVAHPGDFAQCPRQVIQQVTLAIGPEGGWIPYELEKLVAAGLQPVQLGERILRVETAVTALIGRLF